MQNSSLVSLGHFSGCIPSLVKCIHNLVRVEQETDRALILCKYKKGYHKYKKSKAKTLICYHHWLGHKFKPQHYNSWYEH